MAVSETARPNWADKNAFVSRSGGAKTGSARVGSSPESAVGPVALLASSELMSYLPQGLGQGFQ